MKKTTGHYTADAAKALKVGDRIFCKITDTGEIFVCNGYLIFRMTVDEYESIVRPLAHCEPGTWTIDKKGNRTDTIPLDPEALFIREARKAASAAPLAACPLQFQRTKPARAMGSFYSAEGDFAAFFDVLFLAAVAPGATVHTTGAVAPAIFAIDELVTAMILPVRPEADAARAVKAYFNAPATTERSAESEKLQSELTACKQALAAARAECDNLLKLNEDLQNELTTCKQALATARAECTEQPAEPIPQPEPAKQSTTEAPAPAAQPEPVEPIAPPAAQPEPVEPIAPPATEQPAATLADLKKAERAACAAFMAVPETDRATQAATLAAWRETRQALTAAQATEAEPIPQPEATPAPAAQPEPVEQPAEIAPQTAAERIAARWAQMPGLTATIKGAQTGAPVVWIAGDTKRHARTIKAEGGRWSCKRSAYYFRVA
jgi:hypothetical protein